MERFLDFTMDTVRFYLRKRVSRAAAALCYYVTLSLFPMLICLYEMLGSLFPTTADILDFAGGLIPPGTLDTIVDYLGYVTANHSRTMLVMAVLAMATASSAAFRTLNFTMKEIRGGGRLGGGFALVFSFLFSLIFLAAMYFAAIVIISGSWFLSFIDRRLPWIEISGSWRWVRFLILFWLVFGVLLGIYRITAPKGKNVHVFSGASLASGALVGVSILFSHFIGLSVRYPLVYGSLASVMILMFWLFLCGNIIFLGNIINVLLERRMTQTEQAASARPARKGGTGSAPGTAPGKIKQKNC